MTTEKGRFIENRPFMLDAREYRKNRTGDVMRTPEI